MKTKVLKVSFTSIMEIAGEKTDEEKVNEVKRILNDWDSVVNIGAVSGCKVFYDGFKYVHENTIDEAMDFVLTFLLQFNGDAYVTGVEVLHEHCFDN